MDRGIGLAAVLAVACSSGDGVDARAAMLAVPPGGRVEAAAAPARNLDRVETAVCYAGRTASRVGEELAASLTAAGWRDVVIEPHPAIAGRLMVRAARDAGRLGLAGRIDDRAATCDGARVAIGVHDVPPDAHRRFAGPTGPARPNRLGN